MGETLPSICVDEGFIQNRSSIRTIPKGFTIFILYLEIHTIVVEIHRLNLRHALSTVGQLIITDFFQC